MTTIYPEFKDIEKGDTRESEISIKTDKNEINVKETFCDKFLFIHRVIVAIAMFLLFIVFIVMVCLNSNN